MTFFFYAEYHRTPEEYTEPAVILRKPDPLSTPEPAASEPEPETYYKVGDLRITEERRTYVDGEMKLYIPRLSFEGPVYDGIEDPGSLDNGVGLYEYAVLPGPLNQNANVSIAGNRDTGGREFYAIDTLQEGDRIYLLFRDMLYTYEYRETFITDQFNWDPIRIREYPCITLQSSHPPEEGPNGGYDRIFVVGQLIDAYPAIAFPDGAEEAGTGPGSDSGSEAVSQPPS